MGGGRGWEEGVVYSLEMCVFLFVWMIQTGDRWVSGWGRVFSIDVQTREIGSNDVQTREIGWSRMQERTKVSLGFQN